ncbi:hypothetical protein [Winogradskyella tangerina]|uniref:hypothetical protein n=1 Tax=Winogradskyella tangerina TaxID=2023240 RepID=UPI000DBE43FA|nr:hypothetical protein [Winogradskyella tangerina]
MKTLLIYTAVFFTLLCFKSETNNNIIGQWKIDLRPTPDADAYYQTLVISSIDDNTFEGRFYGSAIENAYLNKNWEKLFFAFTTKDASNSYYHSGYILDGNIYGISYCPNRELTAPWTGIKKKKKN